MEQEYDVIKIDNVIFNYPQRPSKKSIIVGIPMFVYHIQTNSFKSGLNFFQKAVLKFKAKPGFPNELIAQYLGIDQKLVDLIQSELVLEKLIGEDGLLTDKGQTQKMLLDGLIVNDNKKQIGYIFRYLNEDKYFPFYVNEYRTPNITSETEPRIKGLKGDDFSYKVLYGKDILNNIYHSLPPSEQKILSLIRNKSYQEEEFDQNQSNESELAIKFIPDSRPHLVWVCTYAYLKDLGNDVYASDWSVLDPFSKEPEDNVSLKLHISHCFPELRKKIDNEFADSKTLGAKIYKEAIFYKEKQIASIILKDFPSMKLEHSLSSHLESVVGAKIDLEYDNYTKVHPARTFAASMQSIFEHLLKRHREKFPTKYEEMENEFAYRCDRQEYLLNEIFKTLYDKDAPRWITNCTSKNLHNPISLKYYYVATLLTKMYTDQLYLLLIKYHAELYEISKLRNDRGHGHTDSERVDERLTKQQVDELYSFLKSFINEYTNL